jgi:hypothetical protein
MTLCRPLPACLRPPRVFADVQCAIMEITGLGGRGIWRGGSTQAKDESGGSADGRQRGATESGMDEELEVLDREALIAEVKRLRGGIRQHRDSSGQELCWHHPQLWALLPERTDPLPEVPEWPQFLRGCLRYRESLDRQLPDAPRTTREFQSDGGGAR